MAERLEIGYKDLIAPCYYKAWNEILDHKYSEYWFRGGRGSCKSSFISLIIVLGIMHDRNANAVVFRKVGSDIRDSVFEQILWAIDKLGVSHLWEPNKSLLRFKYKPTEQMILCRGLDDPTKVKSIKTRRGYFKFTWYEELAQFSGIEEIRNTGQSIQRGGKRFYTFCSYNPPKSASAWVNAEAEIPNPDRVVYSSSYLDIPEDWLGEEFIRKAEILKQTDIRAYRHEYLGEVTGTGGAVFCNLELREISDDEIASFDNYRYGIDWGYKDPNVFSVSHYDWKREIIYIFDEIYKKHTLNKRFGELILEKNPGYDFVWCDSANSEAIAALSSMGINCQGVKKGKDSIKNGIMWLQNRVKIVIDPIRAPNHAREFERYEYKKDREGDWTDNFMEKFNHTIDAVRYAYEEDSITGGLF